MKRAGHQLQVNSKGEQEVAISPNDVLEFAWSLTVAPEGSLAQLLNPTAMHPGLTIDRPGPYVPSPSLSLT